MDDELVQFLRARLDEDAAAAEAASGVKWEACNPQQPYLVFDVKAYRENRDLITVGAVAAVESDANRAHIARHDPARVLAEVEAKRQMVDLAAGMLAAAKGDSEVDHYGGLSAAEETLLLLARPFRDHPDFDSSWLEG